MGKTRVSSPASATSVRGASRPPRPAGKPSASGNPPAPIPAPVSPRLPWTFLTNHSHVLICLWREPGVRLRDVADKVGITERAVQAIVADLEEAGFLTRTRQGRRNHYEVHADRSLRHPVEANRTVKALLEMAGA